MLARPIRKLRRKFPWFNFIEEGGMVRVIPGRTYLFTDTTGHGRTEVILTPGRFWKFQGKGFGYTELTIAVNAERAAELAVTVVVSFDPRRTHSTIYPADLEGWKRMMTDLRRRNPKLWGKDA